MNSQVTARLRNVAITGAYASGKTTLLESLLFVTGTITRKGRVQDQNTVGDSSPEARKHQMSTEVTAASTECSGIQFTFLDCPGSVEFTQETRSALIGADAAVVVCEPEAEKVLALSPLFKFLDDWEIPHLVFINKMDRANTNFGQVLQSLQSVSNRPLVLHQFPIGQGEGFVDLPSEQAFQYHAGAPADPIPLPDSLREQEQAARAEMLEVLADFDDHLLEELLAEIDPPQEEVVQDLKLDLSADLIVPVFVGMAERDFGVRHLLDALLKEAPEPTITAARRGVASSTSSPVAQVLKTYVSSQGGKLSLVRVWQGTIEDGMELNGVRVGGLYRLIGQQQLGLKAAVAGDIVALGRLEGIKTGDTLMTSNSSHLNLPQVEVVVPVFAWAITAHNRSDEVKLSSAIAKLLEEDQALDWEYREDSHEMILWGQGEIHLAVTLERLQRKYNLPVKTQVPQVPYRESIRHSTSSHGRYKHQSGGHGQFGDVHLNIQPLPRGDGFRFSETIVGGVVPRQYIPGVEIGVREFLERGVLGFPVVDIAVTLTNGSYHTVDSSEQAFKQAARIAMQSGLPQCHPVLLEPVGQLKISTPSEFTAKVLGLVSGRRGQILGYEARPGWQGWDQVSAYLPQAEMQNLIGELRSLTLGLGTFDWQYDHLQEVPEKVAKVLVKQ